MKQETKLINDMLSLVKEAARPGEGPTPTITDRMNQFFSEGTAHDKDISEDDVDPRELVRGIEVEMEHTKDQSVAKKIALDHLAEIDDYYTRLDRMEAQAGDDDNNY